MYEDETGYQKGEIQKRKIVETEIFSVDGRIVISRIIAIMGKRKERVSEKQIITYFHAKEMSKLKEEKTNLAKECSNT
jgi:competence protein ComGF